MDSIGIIVISLLSAVLILPYLYIHISAVLSVGKSVPAFDQLLRKGTDTGEAIIFYFMSVRCSKCRSLTPHIAELQASNPNIIIVDIKKAANLAKDFHVYGTPTLMVVKDNVIQKVKLGGFSRRKTEMFISSQTAHTALQKIDEK